jgi:hypothetical protein
MSCYVHNLVDLLTDLGHEDTKQNRKRLDLAIRRALGAEDLHCPEVWKRVKEKRETSEFRQAVAEALAS